MESIDLIIFPAYLHRLGTGKITQSNGNMSSSRSPQSSQDKFTKLWKSVFMTQFKE